METQAQALIPPRDDHGHKACRVVRTDPGCPCSVTEIVRANIGVNVDKSK